MRFSLLKNLYQRRRKKIDLDRSLAENDIFEDEEELPEMNEEDIFKAREVSLAKFTSSLQSICERYNRPFEDGDEIDIMSLQLIVDKGYLRNTSHRSIFGRGIDEQLVNMIENRQITRWTDDKCRRCQTFLNHHLSNVYCQNCKDDLKERKSLMLPSSSPMLMTYSSPIRISSQSTESSQQFLSSPSQLSGKNISYHKISRIMLLMRDSFLRMWRC